MGKRKTKQQIIEELQIRLQELEDTLEAIRSGAVDAIVASGPAGDQVYTLEGADQAYHTMVESMNEGAVTLMQDGTILYSNRKFGQMTGASPSGIIGRRIHDFVSVFDQQILSAILDTEDRDCSNAELTLRNGPGADVPVRLSASPIELSGAKALTLVITDLSAQKRYEEIVAAEKLSRRILEQAHEGIAVCIDGCIVRANRALYEICGSIPLMQTFDQIFSFRISESQTFSVAIPESGKTIQNQEVRYQRPDGRIFNLILNAGPLVGRENKVLGSLISLLDITGRKQAEEVLQATLQRFYLMLASMYSGVLLMTDEGRIEFVNQAFCDFYGLKEATNDLTGLPSRDLLERIQHAYLHPDEAAARIREILQRGLPVKGEEFAMQDGRTALRDFVPLSVDGKSCGRLWIHFDITELKQAEERLRQSESRFREMAETVPSIIFTALPDGSTDYFNERALNYAGLPAEEVMGEGWLKVVHPEDVDRSIRSVAESLRTGQPYEVMQRLRGADGSYRWFMARARAILDEKGAVLRWFGSATDIHDMIVAGKALQESEARFRLLSETAARLLVSEDPQVLVNDLCRDVMEHLDCQAFFNFMVDERAGRLRLNACAGIPEEEVRKLEWLDYGVAVCGCVARDNARIIAEDIFHTPDVRTELVRSYGIQAYCCHPLKAQDRLIGTLSFGTKTRARFTAEEVDLMRIVADQVAVAMQRVQSRQELRASEEALRHANEQLEQRVRERTSELVLLLEDLEKSRDDLRKLASELVMTEERERKRIAGVLHDDIAQLLASARMQLSLLQGIPSDQKETLEAAKAFLLQSLRETRGLMHDLGNPVLFEMGLQAACETFANSLMERHPVRIRCDIREAYKHLNPDVKTILYQLIRELLNNVVKHSKARNAHVIVEMENGHFRVRVTDDGVGFDPQAIGTPTVEGGFGLYSIRERLIALSGSLSIESTLGAGTVVTAVLPAALG